jgi:hypothetical protein
MKKIIINLLLIIVGIMIALLLAEATLWAIDFSKPIPSVPDPVTGSFRRPNMEFRYRDEGDAQVRTNSAGLRDREHNQTKPENTVRIAVLGDSYAEAYQVNEEQTFWKILEHKLNECRPFGEKKRVEVINFGVSGYGTAQELLLLRNRVWSYDPDIVLLAFLTGNDVRNNSKVLEPEKIRPFFIFNERDELIQDNSFLEDPVYIKASSYLHNVLRRLSDYSRFIQLIAWVRSQFPNWRAYNQYQANSGKESPLAEVGLDESVYDENPNQVWQEAWRITEALLTIMNKEVKLHGAKFLVVTLSSGIQVLPDRKIRDDYMKLRDFKDLFYPDKRIKALGEREGFGVLMIAPYLQKIAEETNTFMHGFKNTSLGEGHWNGNGHKYAGEFIANYWCIYHQ